MHTPHPENRATAVLTPFPGIPASAENPDSRSAVETSTDYPVPDCPRFNPGPARSAHAGTAERKNPARGGVNSSIIEATMPDASS